MLASALKYRGIAWRLRKQVLLLRFLKEGPFWLAEHRESGVTSAMKDDEKLSLLRI